jgi:hypothetical protein
MYGLLMAKSLETPPNVGAGVEPCILAAQRAF